MLGKVHHTSPLLVADTIGCDACQKGISSSTNMVGSRTIKYQGSGDAKFSCYSIFILVISLKESQLIMICTNKMLAVSILAKCNSFFGFLM